MSKYPFCLHVKHKAVNIDDAFEFVNANAGLKESIDRQVGMAADGSVADVLGSVLSDTRFKSAAKQIVNKVTMPRKRFDALVRSYVLEVANIAV